VADRLTALEGTVAAALVTFWSLAMKNRRAMGRDVLTAYLATETLLGDFTVELYLSRRAGEVRRATRNAAEDVIAQANALTRVAAQSRS
jgi:hypothetical protein